MSFGYYALSPNIFRPAMRMILSISLSPNAIVVTTIDGVVPGNHHYVTGTVVRLDIPKEFGMPQANQMTGTIIVIDDTSFSIDIDTSLFQPYVIPSPLPPHLQSFGQVVPIGSANDTLKPAVKNVLPFSVFEL